MSRLVIVLGDRTSHGGVVEEVIPLIKIDGRPVAKYGGRIWCPTCKAWTTIDEGDTTKTFFGHPCVLHGHRTSCGASLISGRQTLLRADAATPAERESASGGLPAADAMVRQAQGGPGNEAAKAGPRTNERPLTAEETAKARRWQARKQLIADGRQSRSPEVLAAADRLEKNRTAVEMARLDQHVYHPDSPPPTGWSDCTQDAQAMFATGLEPGDFKLGGSNFGAGFYRPRHGVFGDDMRPTLAFKGTQNLEDWNNNISQGLHAQSSYYAQAIKIGGKLKLAHAAGGINLTGHSLGGGLASAASEASGAPAWTFNAAGLNPGTLRRAGRAAGPSAIQAYHVDHEMLTVLQETHGLGYLVPGKWILGKLMPRAPGERSVVPGTGGAYARHGIDQVIQGIERQKADDQATLRRHGFTEPPAARAAGS